MDLSYSPPPSGRWSHVRIRTLLLIGLVLAAPSCGDEDGAAGPSTSAATAFCPITEGGETGPEYEADAPLMTALADPETEGVPFALAGRIVDSSTCEPIPAARIEFWQAGDDGSYDNGSALRGTFDITGGDYEIETTFPGPAADASESPVPHVHLLVTAPGYRPVAIRLQLPDGGDAASVDPALGPVISYAGNENGRAAVFDISLRPEG